MPFKTTLTHFKSLPLRKFSQIKGKFCEENDAIIPTYCEEQTHSADWRL